MPIAHPHLIPPSLPTEYLFHCHNLIHEDNDMLRAYRVTNVTGSLNAPTASKFVANPLIGIIYSNYKYSDPMLNDTAAKSTPKMPSLASQMGPYLNGNVYRIFYPNKADERDYGTYYNPWKSTWCPIPLFSG